MAWQTDDVTALAGAPAAAFVLPVGYASERQGAQHLIYLGLVDNHLHELWSDDNGWHTDDLTAATGAPEPAALDHLAGYAFEAQGTQHIIYVGAADRHIDEVWSDASGWHTGDLTAAANAAAPAGGVLAAFAFEAQRTQHVVYEALSDKHIHELWSDANGWHTDDLTAATGAPQPGGGGGAGYAFESQGTLHVFYPTGNRVEGPVQELWWDRTTGWHTDDLGVSASHGSLAAYVFEAQGTQHVIYTAGSGADYHLHELWWDTKGRHADDLTTAAGAPQSGGGALVGYAFESQRTQHLFYEGLSDHHVHELWSDASGRHTDDLTAATGAPPVGSGGASSGAGLTGYVFAAQGTQHVFYVSSLDNHIHELWWGPKASARQPGPSIGATPSSAVPSHTTTASTTFVGHWHVHGAVLDITPTTATITEGGAHPCSHGSQRLCRETDDLRVVSGDDKELTLQVTAVRYTDDSGASVPNQTLPAVGDSMRLDWQAPGLLKTTILQGFPGSSDGNPYWCGAGISQANSELCGA
ncbi:hypothetical protein BOO86_05325 [Mycobacterium sp. CBMA 234]|uniref:hypothetical protein n=1 Tax=Mycolicibacterium sp. CBMA 234 TaxID=1918495 RepID=UPI001390B23B|nr:hypothetical protein [Mycolicibacterium sp. CBMA 234]MUL63878.1 hypothetical protein [Mycolicibacterium sp. CBMA 234]